MGATKEIAEWVCSTGYSNFDPDLVKYTKKLCVNGLGTPFVGCKMRAGQAVINYVRELRAPPEAGVIAGGFRTSVEYAAFANGATSHAPELEDDAEPESCYTVGIFPLAFALGEKLHLSGKEVIEAFVIGFEVAVKLAAKCGEALTRGFITDCQFGTVGAAATAAKMLKLGVHETTMALSIAASQSSGLLRQCGTGGHLYESGLCGRNGMSAAMLAKLGLTGQPDILECPNGLCYALAGVTDLDDLQLGTFRLRSVIMKKYPCCNVQHHIINTVIELRKEHNISADDVETIQIDTNPGLLRTCRYHHPSNEDNARFSLPHSIAAALLDDKVWVDSYTDEKARDPKFHAVRDKVKMVVHAEWDTGGIAGPETPVTIRLKNGVEYRKVAPSAGVTIVLSDEEIFDRYMDSALRVLSRDKAEQALRMILALDEVKDISELMTILAFPERE